MPSNLRTVCRAERFGSRPHRPPIPSQLGCTILASPTLATIRSGYNTGPLEFVVPFKLAPVDAFQQWMVSIALVADTPEKVTTATPPRTDIEVQHTWLPFLSYPTVSSHRIAPIIICGTK